MKPSLLLAAVLAVSGLSACVQNYAERDVAQGVPAASLAVVNAPADARILVDGRDVGAVADHPRGAPVSAGRHEVVIARSGTSLHRQAVYVAAGAHIEVRVP